MSAKAATELKFNSGLPAHPGNSLAPFAAQAWHFACTLSRRRELRRLAQCDDRVLADIGLTRDDLRHALSQSFWHDPTDVLAGRVGKPGIDATG